MTIGITMGDPCGVGAEIIVKCLADEALRRRAKFVVFGLSEQLEYTASQLELSFDAYRDTHENIRHYSHDLVVLDYDEISVPPAMPRGPSKMGGLASMAFCVDAIEAAQTGLIDAIVTAPIAKSSWKMAKYRKYPGHTELLADKCDVRQFAMMFAAKKLRVTLATIHDPIHSLTNKLTIGAVYNPIALSHKALQRWWGIDRPRIGVCGLNPHAGENGHIGDDERRVIEPAILMACENGIDARGPYPADTIYNKALNGEFDLVVAMYHDQGLIPIKILGWEEAVNVTLGLPIIRTSPDHGTAFDIAGKFQADPSSMRCAIELAIDMAEKGR